VSDVVEDPSGLRDRLERDGHVEFRVKPAKAISQALLTVVIATAGVAVAWAYGPLFGIVATLFAVWIVGALALLWLDQVFGAGPALRIDQDGVTIRRWGEPLILGWRDVCVFFPHRPSSRFGPGIALLMSVWVWHDYRSSRPAVLSWADRITHYRGRYLVLLKILDYSARDILAFLDEDTVDGLTRLEPPYRLVLDFGENGESPLWLRGGREARLERLPLSPGLVRTVQDWNTRLNDIAEDKVPTPSAEVLRDECRSLAAQIQSELGSGSQVLAAPDVPKFGT
jgi:hypothetical protein